MNKSQLTKLLRSGNFTIIGQDSDCIEIYKGHINYDEIVNDEGETVHEPIDFSDFEWECGYVSGITALLAHALKGKVDSI